MHAVTEMLTPDSHHSSSSSICILFITIPYHTIPYHTILYNLPLRGTLEEPIESFIWEFIIN
jgi:hypothetical protein